MKYFLVRSVLIGLFVTLTFSLSSPITQATIDPLYKECLQRGFFVESEEGMYGEYCIFPDNSRCSIESINSGTCDNAFLVENYCVEQGNAIWDENKCCEGLKPSLAEGVVGQATCQPIQSSLEETLSQEKLFPFLLLTMALLASLFLCMLLVLLFEKKKS